MRKILLFLCAVFMAAPVVARADCRYGMTFWGSEKEWEGDPCAKTAGMCVIGYYKYGCTGCSGGKCVAAARLSDRSSRACATHAVTASKCLKCHDGWELSGDKCVCKQGTYDALGDQNVVNDLNAACTPCRSEQSGMICNECSYASASLGGSEQYSCDAWTCANGYYKTGVKISDEIKVGDHVIKTSGYSYCEPCSGLSVENGTCAACSENGVCTEASCDSGYRAQGAKCVKIPCPDNCAECDSGACLRCAAGYVLKNGACAVKPKTQVAFCLPDKTLSADLCCCVSK